MRRSSEEQQIMKWSGHQTGTSATHTSWVKVNCTVSTGTRMMGAFAQMNMFCFFLLVCEQMGWKSTLPPLCTHHCTDQPPGCPEHWQGKKMFYPCSLNSLPSIIVRCVRWAKHLLDTRWHTWLITVCDPSDAVPDCHCRVDAFTLESDQHLKQYFAQ